VDDHRDFFVSYTGTDTAWAEWIADTLEHAGYSTMLQVWDFHPGSAFIARMHQAIQTTQHTIAVLSLAYLASEFGEAEWRSVFAMDPTGERGLLIPVRVAACQPPGLLRDLVYVDLVGLGEADAAARLRAGVTRGRAKPPGPRPFPGGLTKAGEVGFPGRRPSVFDVPPRNRHFTGRNYQLQTLHHQLAETATSAVVQANAVHGLGGIGKTQLAIEYAHRYASDYELIWWIPAEQPATIPGRLATFARRLGPPDRPNIDEQVQRLFDELGRRGRWLLIFDNAEAPTTLVGCRPPSGEGHILVTSRNPNWGAIAKTIHLDVLDHDDAVEFLRHRLGRDDPALATLARELGELPLALEQAAAYLEETQTPPAEYVDLLHEHAGKLFTLGKPATAEQTIATTWTISLSEVEVDEPAAAQFLALFAFFAPDDIPRSLLPDQPDALPEPLRHTAQDQLAYNQILGALHRYSLISVTESAVAIHRLVQAVVRGALDEDAARGWSKVAVQVVLSAFPGNSYEVDTWPVCSNLLTHAVATTRHAIDHQAASRTTAYLLGRAAGYLWSRGESQRAKPLVEQALAICEVRFGFDHPAVAKALDQLGILLDDLDDLPGAQTAHERAISIYEATGGAEGLAVAGAWDNLGGVLGRLGNLAEAQAAHERALAIYETHLGPDHPSAAACLHNLAHILRALDDLDKSRTLIERALSIREAELGTDHPDTARSLTSLATIVFDQGDLPFARALLRRALTIYENKLGSDHPHTADNRQFLTEVIAKLDAQQ
jgi:tetratricopeptide (TPR) repeat protein